VINLKHKKCSHPLLLHKQQGAVLILMAFIIGLAMTGLLIKSYTAAALQAERDEDTMQALMQAKEAMIGWAVSYDEAPGQFPWPDRRETTNPNYDGQSDCSSANFNLLNSLNEPNFLGQIPHIRSTNPCNNYPGIGHRFRDSSGSNLWYAVSRNLVRQYSAPASNPKIHPGIINNPLRPWMVIRDSAGAIVSDRVAVVILAPGPTINGQDRSGNAPLPANFLDQVTIGGITYRNFDYDTDDEDFILGSIVNDTFNDKLVYITIDELISALERRVGEVARAELKAYQDLNGYYPYAAQMGTTQNYSGEQTQAGTGGLTEGHLPINYQSCNYTRTGTVLTDNSSLTCEQSIFDQETSGIERVRFTRSGGTPFLSSTGSCAHDNDNCDCTGAGSCYTAISALNVTCTTTSCNAVSLIGAGALGSFETRGGKFTSRSGGCAHTVFPTKDATTGCHVNSTGGADNNGNATMTCSASNGSFSSSSDARFDNALPAWFEENNWQDYVYYHLTRPAVASIAAGAKNTEAVVITVGRVIDATLFPSKGSAQFRPSCNALNEYLDSVENTDGDGIYDSTAKPRTANYNDQIFVVSP